MLNNKRVVLAYSGSLDTSIAVHWLKAKGYDVVTVYMDLGEKKDIAEIKVQGIQVGAVCSYVVYAKEELPNEIQLHNPISLPSVRAFLSEKLVEIAGEENAVAIAHGCQTHDVHFKSLIQELNPTLNVLAPVEEWNWSQEEKTTYALDMNITIPVLA